MAASDKPGDLHVPAHPVRFVTAAALFDGHDAAINIMRRILQAQGAEVIHLGHDRSVREVVDAVLDEDAQAVAISSALRDVSRQLIRNRSAFGVRPQDMPVFGTSAATFNDNGVTALYQHLAGLLAACGLPLAEGVLPAATGRTSTDAASVIAPARTGYLAEIAGTVRGYHEETARQAQAVRRVQRLAAVRAELSEDILAERSVASLLDQAQREVGADSAELIAGWPAVVAAYSGPEQVVRIRDRELRTQLTRESLSGTAILRVALPRYADHGDLLRFLREENLPGYFPFTAGVFPFKREGEAPARMFAGEGDPFRTNRRFKLLSAGNPATRLSTAFDSVTLYGRDPPRPARTRSASSPSPWPTGSPTWRPTWPAVWPSTTSRRTCRSSSPTAWTRSTP